MGPEAILDLASGSGDLALALERACPLARLVAADFCEPMLLKARRSASALLVAADGQKLPFPDNSFDVLTIAFGLRNMTSWSNSTRGIPTRAPTRRAPPDPRFLSAQSPLRQSLPLVPEQVSSPGCRCVTGHKEEQYISRGFHRRVPNTRILSQLLRESGYKEVAQRPNWPGES